jgi:hypothetical protein
VSFFSSPRRRRRAAWIGAAALVVVGFAGFIWALPSGPKREPEVFHGKAATILEGERTVGRETRREISQALRDFVPAALGRHDLARGWELAGPGLRVGATRAEWLHGVLPLVAYDARRAPMTSWDVIEATPRLVTLDLLLQPAPASRQGPAAFTVQMRRLRHQWKVNSIYTTELFPAAGDGSGAGSKKDKAAAAAGSADESAPIPTSRISKVWLLVPAAVVLSGLLIVVLVVTREGVRARRSRKRDRLPDLPGGPR